MTPPAAAGPRTSPRSCTPASANSPTLMLPALPPTPSARPGTMTLRSTATCANSPPSWTSGPSTSATGRRRPAGLGARRTSARSPPIQFSGRTGPRAPGTAAGYRERYGRTDPREAIGREPAAPEARADWHAARAALGIPHEQAEVTAASAGELWARRARYERELAWAPPHVADDLRATALARREHATEATLIRARARTGNARSRAERPPARTPTSSSPTASNYAKRSCLTSTPSAPAGMTPPRRHAPTRGRQPKTYATASRS